MNKFILGSIVVVVVVLGGFLVISNNDSKDSTDSATTPNSSTQPISSSEESEDTAEVIGYTTYSEANLASTKDTKQVVFFHAPWCSTCNAFEKEIVSAGVPEGITILKADYDNDTELKQRYGVRLQSTFVLLDENGEVEQTWPFGQGLGNDISNLYDQII